MSTATATALTDSPQSLLAGLLDSHQPRSLLTVSLNPIPVVAQWCEDHDCELITIAEPSPFNLLETIQRVDLAVVADQLEYMSHAEGESLLGLLRNLHTDSLVVVYQQTLAPERLRWPANGFFALGCRHEGTFTQDDRSLDMFSYDLDSYNFKRQWNNPRFWANPENWGKYWW